MLGCAAGALAVALAISAHGATIIWGGGTGTFGTAANWVGGSAPGSSDTASFDGWIPFPEVGMTATASASDGSNPPANSIDGSVGTRWGSGSPQNGSEWFKIDLGASMTFSRVVLDSGSNSSDYPRGYSLAVSTDNSSYTTVTSGSGSSQVTTITFTAQTARYIKISQTGSSGSNWWSIAEYTVFGASAWVPLSTTGWGATESRLSPGDTGTKAFDGDRSTRWSTGGSMANTDWFKVDMGSSQTFSRVEWDVGSNGVWSSDYPASWTLAVSTNDTSYTTIITSSSSTNLTNVIFAAQTARYIKISSNSTNGCCWWGIAELRAFTPTQSTQLSRNGWVVSASNTDGGSPLGNAIDNNTGSRWATGVGQSTGLWFEVDMTQSLSIDAITMDAYTNTNDYPNAWKLETSTNNSTWTTITSNQTGSAPYIHFQFAAVTARYVRVTQTGTNGNNWWSIAEFNVYGAPVNASISANATVSAVDIAESVTLTQASGNTLTTTGAFTQSTGTFTGGNSQISVGGDFNLSGGTFTSTSGVLEVSGAYNATGGTFTHNSGRVLLDSTSSKTFATNGNTFYDLAINDGLVGYWKLDDGTTPVVDSSGWAQSGTLSNTPTWGAGPTLNFTNGNSITFNGTNQYARISRTTALEPAAVTVSAWVKANGTQVQWAKIVSKTYTNDVSSPYGSYELQLNPGGSDSTVVSFATGTTGPSSTGISSATAAVPNGTWTHVVGVYDPNASAPQKRLYVNGVSVATATLTGALLYDSTATGDLYIGNNGNTQYLKGSVDEVRIYKRALSDAEINSLYIGNQPGTSLATQTMTGAPTVANDLILASGTLSVGSNGLTITGNWNNYGGIFTASTGTVTLNTTGSKVIRSAGQPFKNLTLSGSGATWTLEDWLKVDSSLTMTNGALSPGSYAVHASDVNKSSGTFAAGTGTVVIDTTVNVTQSTGFSFNSLRIETNETNLVGYWKFDEGQGTAVRDASGAGNDGTLTSTRWTDTLPSAITFDNHAGATFNGTSSYASVGYTSIPSGVSARSISAWVNLSSTSGTQNIFSLPKVGGSILMGFGIRSGALSAWAGGGTLLASTTAPATGSWHHVAYTFDGTTHTVYLDGASPGTGTTVPSGTIASAYIGSKDGTTEYLNGSVDDVRVYNVALTTAQVKNLYAGRYAGVGGGSTVTLGANSTVTSALSIDSGTLYSSSYTMNASSTSNVVSVGSSGTYHIGSATQTMSGGLTVSDSGTVTMDTASGNMSVGSGKTLTMDGTLNASSTSATIQSVSGTYTFSIGSTATATPTLNITGLAVKNTDANGMNINVNHSASTTFTRFDNLVFTNGAGTGAGNYNLQIYATSLFLTSNGCTFDSGVNATVATNVHLQGNGTADGETRAMFGNATCASNKSSCDVYDVDDDASPGTGVGVHPSTDGAIIQWIKSAEADTAGSIEGFPTAAFDWSSFTYYSTYVAYHSANGSTDRVYVRKSGGDAYYSWDVPSSGTIIGTPRWDTAGGTHYVYVATTGGKVYRLVDDTTNHTLTADTASPWNGANNPFDCSCSIVTPLAQDTSNLYFGGVASSTYKLWTVSKTSTTRQPTGSPLATSATTSNAAPAIWASGDTYTFLGQAGRVTKLDTTTQALTADNTNPGGTNAVTGRITVISSTLYAGDDNGYMWSLDPGANFGASSGTYKNWGYHDATNHASCGGVCQVKSHYIDAQYTRVYYGDQDGHLYVLNSTGAAVTGYPWRPGTSSDAFASAPLYRGGVIVIGATDGFLYVIDQNSNGSVPALIQTYKFGGSSTAVSGIAYDNNSGAYLVSTANATNKDGKLYYITASTDPTPSFP